VEAKALYVHLPFCAHLCAYCDFPKVLYKERWAFSYVEELEKEARSYGPILAKSLYFGGGTPSVLPLPLLEKLLSFYSPLLTKGGEFTVECNPETINEEKLALFAAYGVNRLSFGVESASPRLLALMGRKHTFLEAKKAITLAKKLGFHNINADLIYALPGESLEELQNDIAALLSLEVDHLSTYCLSVNPGTLFYNKGYKEMEEGLAAEQYERILHELRKAGYDRYEVSNFCRNGKKSAHNLAYWKDEEYYGFGMGASGYLKGVRYDNTRNLQAYLAGKWREKEEKVDPQSALEYFFLTTLRLEEGFLLKDFADRFGYSFLKEYEKEVEKLQKEGLVELSSTSFRATDRGILLLDRILLTLYR
jgi:oxygen-independent coproporphyrinogen-3 oxidase